MTLSKSEENYWNIKIKFLYSITIHHIKQVSSHSSLVSKLFPFPLQNLKKDLQTPLSKVHVGGGGCIGFPQAPQSQHFPLPGSSLQGLETAPGSLKDWLVIDKVGLRDKKKSFLVRSVMVGWRHPTHHHYNSPFSLTPLSLVISTLSLSSSSEYSSPHLFPERMSNSRW